MFPLIVMLHLFSCPRLDRRGALHYTPTYRDTDLSGRGAPDGAPRGHDLRRRRVAAGERALGPLVPAARVVEIALEQVDDAVQPRRQRRLVLLDDLVGLLPLARRQMLDRSVERIAHEVLQSSWEIVVRLKSSARRRGRGCPRTTPRSRAVT